MIIWYTYRKWNDYYSQANEHFSSQLPLLWWEHLKSRNLTYSVMAVDNNKVLNTGACFLFCFFFFNLGLQYSYFQVGLEIIDLKEAMTRHQSHKFIWKHPAGKCIQPTHKHLLGRWRDCSVFSIHRRWQNRHVLTGCQNPGEEITLSSNFLTIEQKSLN